MIPLWLHWLAIASLVCCTAFAVAIAVDAVRRPQHMGIMNLVWPISALYGGVLVLWFYARYGRAHGHMHDMHMHKPPFPAIAATGTTHCGAGCTLGDIISEWLAFFYPGVAVWFGWHGLFAEKMFAVWIIDFIFAFVFGIFFQYFAIAPMRGLSFRDGIIAALKSDTLTLTAWQIGMYGFMAFGQFYLFGHLLGAMPDTDTPEFWFLMQFAMIAGFVTSYPVNWWLIRIGIKEEM